MSHSVRSRTLVAGVILALAIALSSAAANAAGAYADAVLRYDPAYGGRCVPSNPNFIDPSKVLGPPDYSGGANGTGALSLGRGGLLEVSFSAPITNSGDSSPDLRIIEIGGFNEQYFLALRPIAPTTPQDLADLGLLDANADGFFEFGLVTGAFLDVDLDASFSQSRPLGGIQFDAVQVIDLQEDYPTCTTTVGADIDAFVNLNILVAVTPTSWGNIKVLYRN